MKYLEYQNLQIPKIGLGTWMLERDQCTHMVEFALDKGCELIDTAQIYGNEEYVGRGIIKSGIDRRNLFLISKVWRDNLDPDKVVQTTKESLERLQTDYLDLMLVHWPNDNIDTTKYIEAMVHLKEMHLTKMIGVSNFPTHLMEKVQKVDSEFVCNQVEYHPYIDQSPVEEWLTQRDKFLICYSPLARGRVLRDPLLKKLADKYDVTVAQLVLAWQINKPGVVTIPKASSEEHLLDNLGSIDLELEPEDMARIDELRKQNKRLINPEFAPQWDQPVL